MALAVQITLSEQEWSEPFDWTFTREDLANLLTRIDERDRQSALALAA